MEELANKATSGTTWNEFTDVLVFAFGTAPSEIASDVRESDIYPLLDYLTRTHVDKSILLVLIDSEYRKAGKTDETTRIIRTVATRKNEQLEGTEHIFDLEYFYVHQDAESFYYDKLEPLDKRQLFLESGLERCGDICRPQVIPSSMLHPGEPPNTVFVDMFEMCKNLKPEGQVIFYNVAYWMSTFRRNVLFENMCEVLYIANHCGRETYFLIPELMGTVENPARPGQPFAVVRSGRFPIVHRLPVGNSRQRKTKSRRGLHKRRTWRRRF